MTCLITISIALTFFLILFLEMAGPCPECPSERVRGQILPNPESGEIAGGSWLPGFPRLMQCLEDETGRHTGDAGRPGGRDELSRIPNISWIYPLVYCPYILYIFIFIYWFIFFSFALRRKKKHWRRLRTQETSIRGEKKTKKQSTMVKIKTEY